MKNIFILILLFMTCLFSSYLEGSFSGEDLIKLKEYSKERSVLKRVSKLEELEKSLTNAGDFQKLKAVNDFFNQFKYKSDSQIYNQADYWATREEFLFKGCGDCEDFVISKYFTLLKLGIDESKLFLVHSIYRKKFHLLLAYESKKYGIFILDNINKRILTLSQRKDIKVLHKLKIFEKNISSLKTSNLYAISMYKWNKLYSKVLNKD